MQILTHAAEEVLENVLRSRWSTWKLAFHDRNQFHDDFALLVLVEQVGHGSGRQDAVEVFEERLLFHVLLTKHKCRSFALHSARPVQNFQILQKVGNVVGSVNFRKF